MRHATALNWLPLFTCLLAIGSARAQTTVRINLGPNGEQADDSSGFPSINADGRYIVFASFAGNLTPGDAANSRDLFVHDRVARTTTRITAAWDGSPSDATAHTMGISAITPDGRYIAYASDATNLIPGDTNAALDVFVYDRLEGTTQRVSVATDGAPGNADSGAGMIAPAISDDGRYVAFVSLATNLVPDDTNGKRDVFIRDRQAGTTTRASIGTLGQQADASSDSLSMSADGRYVAFTSSASHFAPANPLRIVQVYVRDTVASTTEMESVTAGGIPGSGQCLDSWLSADGGSLAFASSARELVAGDTNFQTDGFVRDRRTGAIDRVTMAYDGTQLTSFSRCGPLSADGRWVVINSSDPRLVRDGAGGWENVYLHDRQTGRTLPVSFSPDGHAGNYRSSWTSLTPDARFVAFESSSDNLIPGDTNSTWDVFVRGPFSFASGDLDGNGATDLDDVRLAVRACAGLDEVQPAQLSRGDCDADGLITLADAASIWRIAGGS